MPSSPPPLDPGLASALANIGGLGGGSLKDKVGTSRRQLTQSDILALLQGTARQTATTHSFDGNMPIWVPKQLKPLVRSGRVDPYVGLGGNVGTQAQGDWRVYMGGQVSKVVKRTKWVRNGGGSNPRIPDATGVGAMRKKTVRRKKTGDKTLTVRQALNQPYLWDRNKVQSAIAKMQKAGLNVQSFDDMTQVWEKLVQRAGATYSLSGGKRKVTPWDVLENYRSEIPQAPKRPPGPGDYAFNGTTQQTSQSIDQVDEGQAWSVLRSTVSDLLGKDPTDNEIRDFAYRMSHLAARNPSVTKTTTQYRHGQPVGQSIRNNPGFTPDDMAHSAYDQARRSPGYAEYQAAGTYFNAMLGALGAIGG